MYNYDDFGYMKLFKILQAKNLIREFFRFLGKSLKQCKNTIGEYEYTMVLQK